GRVGRFQAAWRTITRKRVHRVRPSVVLTGLLPGWLAFFGVGASSSLLDAAPLRELIVASVDWDRVRASELRTIVVATDLERRETRVFDNTTLTPDVLLAAAAMPGVFPPPETPAPLPL